MKVFSILVIFAFVWVAEATCLGWPSKPKQDDSMTTVNNLIVERKPDAETMLDVIEAARRIVDNQQTSDITVIAILEAIEGLQGVAEQAKKRVFDCTREDMAKVRKVHNFMLKHSSENAYQPPRYDRLVNKLISQLEIQFATACFSRFRREFLPMRNELGRREMAAMVKFETLLFAVDQYSDLIEVGAWSLARVANGLHLPRVTKVYDAEHWYEILTTASYIYFEKYQLSLNDPKTGQLTIDTNRVAWFFDQLITTTCRYFKRQPKVVDLFTKTLDLAGSVELEREMFENHDYTWMLLAKLSAAHQMCEDMQENLDQVKAIKAITKYIASKESKSYFLKFDEENMRMKAANQQV